MGKFPFPKNSKLSKRPLRGNCCSVFELDIAVVALLCLMICLPCYDQKVDGIGHPFIILYVCYAQAHLSLELSRFYVASVFESFNTLSLALIYY